MTQEIILRRDAERIIANVIPATMPESRVGIIRGIWMAWQKHWDLVNVQNDEMRAAVYARTLKIKEEIIRSEIGVRRALADLDDIDDLIAQDRELRRSKHALAVQKDAMEMAKLRKQTAEYERDMYREERVAQNASLSYPEMIKQKKKQLIDLANDHALALQEIDTDAMIPYALKEFMRAQLNAIFEKACFEISGEAPNKNSSKSGNAKDAALRKRAEKFEAEKHELMNSSMSGEEQRAKMRRLEAAYYEDRERINRE